MLASNPSLVGLMVALALAGCLGDPGLGSPGEEKPDRQATPKAIEDKDQPEAAEATQLLSFDGALGGCNEVLSVISVAAATVQARLPQGFRATDLSSWAVGAGTTRDALLILPSIVCETTQTERGPGSLGAIGVLVEPPSIPGHAHPAGFRHVYFLEVYTNGTLLSNLEGWGYAVEPATMDLTLGKPYPSSAQARIYDVNGYPPIVDIAMATHVVPVEDAFPLALAWHDTPQGLARIQLEVTANELHGPMQCSVRTGTIAHEILRSTECTGHLGFGIHRAPFDARVRYDLLVGVHATS